MNVVLLSGSPSAPSRSNALLEHLQARFEKLGLPW